MADGTDAEFDPRDESEAPLAADAAPAAAADDAPDATSDLAEAETDAVIESIEVTDEGAPAPVAEEHAEAAEATAPDIEASADAAPATEPEDTATTSDADASEAESQAPATEAADEPEAPAAEAPAAPEPPKPVTAVALGLLPEVFVSAVSTQLHFYAPEIVVLPAPPEDERDAEPEQPSGAGSS